MIRRSLRIAVLIGAGLALASTRTALPAGASAPQNQGWWTSTNPGLTAAPAAPPPDVPADGLLVEGGANGSPTAFAAVQYDLASGSAPSVLTLAVAPNSATTPASTLEVCPLMGSIPLPEQGGPAADAPRYSCAHKVTSQPAADGKHYRFAVSSLLGQGTLAVAVLPTAPTDRVVFDKPDAGSLTPDAGQPQTAPAPPDTSTPADNSLSPPSVAGPTDTAAPTPAATSEVAPVALSSAPASSAVSTPAAAPAAAPPAGPPGAGIGVGSGSVAASSTRAGPNGNGSRGLAIAVLVAGVLLGGSLWTFAGHQAATAGPD